MPWPMLLGAVAKSAGGRSFARSAMAAIGVAPKKKRRSRRRLTQGEIMELVHIKNILGKTAAAQALPFYLGKGR